ncbi:MAG: hypothetical protein M1814_006674 [Vezdaea aestivalis]|nr:MAG: hypothetical protein M1814_006674 [Vezdaea aestivalis]
MATMRALRFHGKKDLRLEQVPVLECGKGQVKLKPSFVGICGSDLHEYEDGPNICPTSPHPITGEQVPLTFGHEFSGIVEEVGSEVTDIKVSDRVVVQPIIYDGTCGACKEGLINCCYSNGFVGLSGWGGGLSDHVVLPRSCIFKIPAEVSLEVGALVEPLAVAWHAVNASPFKAGDSVLIIGGGPIGLAVIQSLKARGATNIIVSEPAPRRKQFAQEFGAHHVLDPIKDDVVAKCKELCGGEGPHVAFDAAGVQPGLTQAIHALRARGTLVNIAVWPRTATITPNDFLFKEKKYLGIATYQAGDFQAVVDAIASGAMKPEGMITRKIALEEVEEKGFKALINDKENHVKILVEI